MLTFHREDALLYAQLEAEDDMPDECDDLLMDDFQLEGADVQRFGHLSLVRDPDP